jgi:hypothetical protein
MRRSKCLCTKLLTQVRYFYFLILFIFFPELHTLDNAGHIWVGTFEKSSVAFSQFRQDKKFDELVDYLLKRWPKDFE